MKMQTKQQESLQVKRKNKMDRYEELTERIKKFNSDRDWDQFHSPSNLAKSISIESGELLEWLTLKQL